MSDSKTSGGMGIGGVLFLVFLVLKLTHLIDWSWFWVLSPLWISIGLGLIVLIILFFITR